MQRIKPVAYCVQVVKAKRVAGEVWVPVTSYGFFSEAKHAITDYIVGYYSQQRPHQYNGMTPPNLAEQKYWNDYKVVASFT